jgi:hypothetical protein
MLKIYELSNIQCSGNLAKLKVSQFICYLDVDAMESCKIYYR